MHRRRGFLASFHFDFHTGTRACGRLSLPARGERPLAPNAFSPFAKLPKSSETSEVCLPQDRAFLLLAFACTPLYDGNYASITGEPLCGLGGTLSDYSCSALF